MGDCVHYWKLSDPMAGLVVGFCIHCEKERTFPAQSVRYEDFNTKTVRNETPSDRVMHMRHDYDLAENRS